MLSGPYFCAKFHLDLTKIVLRGFINGGVVGCDGSCGSGGGGSGDGDGGGGLISEDRLGHWRWSINHRLLIFCL